MLKSESYAEHIEVPNWEKLVAEFKPYILNLCKGIVGYHNVDQLLFYPHATKILSYFERLSVVSKAIGLIIIPPGYPHHIHVDGIISNSDPYALNFEIQNCCIPKTRMYRSTKTGQALYTPQVRYTKYNLEDCDLIKEFDLTMPIIFNTQVPHNVWNPTKETRISISFRFFDSTPLRHK